MAYADGFLIVVPTRNLEDYRKLAAKAGEVWLEYGALDYKECAGDDLFHKGLTTSFPKTMRAKRSDSIVFSWILYKDKAHRDRVNKAVMADKRMAKIPDPMPFEPKRMVYGGFNVLVDMKPAKAPAARKAPAAKKAPPTKRAAKKRAKKAR